MHHPIHDVKSFFWVFLFQCMTRGGPGGKRRAELLPGADISIPRTQKVHHLVFCFFHASEDATLINNKQQLFQDPESLIKFVLPYFDPYFDPLKDVVIQWFRQLQLSYRMYDDYEAATIHQKVLRILEDKITELTSMDDDEKPWLKGDAGKFMVQEVARRKRDLELLAPTVAPSLMDRQHGALVQSPERATSVMESHFFHASETTANALNTPAAPYRRSPSPNERQQKKRRVPVE